MASDQRWDARRAAAARDVAGARGTDAAVEIAPYDPGWPAKFAAEVARLERLLPEVAWHHIGSTAVPGLPGKPIVDIMAAVPDLDAPVPVLVDRAGYRYPEAYNTALPGRRWLCRPSMSERSFHLHLVADPADLARRLRFRDALRADAGLAAAYAELKRGLAVRFRDDREAYGAAKSEFIERVEADLGPRG